MVVTSVWRRPDRRPLGGRQETPAQTPLPSQGTELSSPQKMNAVEIESAISELAARFKNDTERLEKLCALCTQMTASQAAKKKLLKSELLAQA